MATGDNVLPPNVPVVLSSPLQAIIDADLPHDFLIDGIPFLAAPSGDDPYMRDFSEDRREQFDNSREAGENSFGQWWLRSQSTFDGGAEQEFLDPALIPPEIARARFDESSFVDPFEPGKVTLASDVELHAENVKRLETVVWTGQRTLVLMDGGTNEVRFLDLPALDNPRTVVLGASGVPQDMTTDGENVYVAIDDSVYRIDDTETAVQIATVTFIGPVVLKWAKQRLILTTGPEVYIVDPAPAAPPEVPPLHYLNPVPAWRYTSVADGPNGIYLSGYSGTSSNVSSMELTDDGGTVTVGPPIEQMPAPEGEQFNTIYFYVNSIFALTSNQGVRMGAFTPYGQPEYGTLMLEGTPCYDVSAWGSLLYVGAEDSVWAINPGFQVGEGGRYALARLAEGLGDTGDDFVVSLTVHDDIFYAAMGGSSRWWHQTGVEADGYLVTSWSRFDTVEPKSLEYIRIAGNFPTGCPLRVMVESIDGATQQFDISNGTLSTVELKVNLPPAEAFRLRFELCEGAELRSYQLKAIAVPLRFGEIILPLFCYDSEVDRDGRQVRRDDYARVRLNALESKARTTQIVTVVDRLSGTSYRALIRNLRFTQINRPAYNSLGGMVTLILRQV